MYSLCSLVCRWWFDDSKCYGHQRRPSSPQRKWVGTESHERTTGLLVLLGKMFNGEKEDMVLTTPSHQKHGKEVCTWHKNIQSHEDQIWINLIVLPMIENGKICMKDQNKYLSGVGMLLYLAKQSRLDIANAMR